MGLRPINDNENRQRADSEPGASATLFGFSSPQRDRFFKGAVHYSANFKRFFNGVHMDLRPINGDEKPPVEPYDPWPSRDRKGADDPPNFRLFFNGVDIPTTLC